MRLFEFAKDDPLRVKLMGIAKQLETQSHDKPMPTDEFLQFLRKNGINLDKADLFDLIKKEPLSNIISDVSNDEVTFANQTDSGQMGDPEKHQQDQQNIVANMASKVKPPM